MIRVLVTLANPAWTAIEAAETAVLCGLDRKHFEVHMACTQRVRPGAAGPSVLDRVRAFTDVNVFPTEFGPSLHGTTRSGVLELIRTAPRVPWNVLQLARYLRDRRIDVIHSSQKPYDALFGVLLAKLTGKKSVLHLHVKYGEWLNKPSKWALRNADVVLTVSKFTAKSVIDSPLGIDPRRVHVVYNALDPAVWASDPDGDTLRRDGDKVRRELGIAPGTPVIGCVGQLNEWKGQADLIDALPLVRDKFPNVQCLVAGKEDRFSQGRAGYASELEARARKLGVEANVRFLGFRSDVRDVHAALDVFALPAWEEGFGLVFLEAMAMGKPVVAIQSGAAPEIVVDEETGFLVEPKKPGMLAGAIVRLLGDSALRERMGRAGRARAFGAFSPTRSAESLADVYRGLVARA